MHRETDGPSRRRSVLGFAYHATLESHTGIIEVRWRFWAVKALGSLLQLPFAWRWQIWPCLPYLFPCRTREVLRASQGRCQAYGIYMRSVEEITATTNRRRSKINPIMVISPFASARDLPANTHRLAPRHPPQLVGPRSWHLARQTYHI